jgi:hypothetical protein
MTCRKENTEIIVRNKPSSPEEWYEPQTFHEVPVGALAVEPWPVKVHLETAWEIARKEHGNLIGTLIYDVTLSNPFGNPEYGNSPKYDFNVGGGVHWIVNAEETPC